LQEIRYGIIGEKQKEAFGSMFNEVDKDKNGSVTLEELKLKMMPGVSRDDIKHFVKVNTCFLYLFNSSLLIFWLSETFDDEALGKQLIFLMTFFLPEPRLQVFCVWCIAQPEYQK